MPNENEQQQSTEPEVKPQTTLIGEQKPAETKPEEKPAEPAPKPEEKKPEAKPEEAAPLTLESIKMPEGFELDKELGGKFLDVMNNKELDPAKRAQALIELQADAMKRVSEKTNELWQDQLQKWGDEIKADKDFGGQKLEANLGAISKLIDAHAPNPAELRKAFDDTGAGNNPQIFRFLSKVASALGEGTHVAGNPPTGGANTQEALAAKLYPTMAKGN